MIQFDYPSGGIGKKERKRYAFTDFRGVDASLAGINVDPSRAVESTNFVDRNGVLHKRYGWEQVYQFDNAIDGFWDFTLDNVNFKICYAGGKFYRLKSNGWSETYTNERLVARQTACYVQNNKAYFIGCGDLLVFRQKDGEYSFVRVVDDEETYIPTTTARILPDSLLEKGLKGRYVRDNVNMLTGWRKNTLVGTPVEDGKDLVYRLDGAPKMFEDAKAMISFLGGKYEFEYSGGNEITPETNKSVYDLTAEITPFYRLTPLPETDTEPTIAYDAITEDGDFAKDWELRIDGENGSAGLRWKREGQASITARNPNTPISYRIYTLYFVGEGTFKGSTRQIPVVRRFFRNSYETFTEDKDGIILSVIWDKESRTCTLTCTKKADAQIHKKLDIDITLTYGYIKNYEPYQVAKATQTTTISIYPNSMTNKKIVELYGELVDEVSRNATSYTKESTLINEKEVSYVEVKETHDIVLPPLQERTISIASSVSGKTAVIGKVGAANYKNVIKLKGASLICNKEDFDAKIDYAGTLTITNWKLLETAKTANVEVKFYAGNDNADDITECKYSTLYGVNGESDRLFLANGDDEKKRNIIFFSEMDDFTYFPDNYTKAVGGNANEIKGFVRLSNGSMATLKTVNGNEPTVFVFQGEYMSGYYDAEEQEPYLLPKFTTIGVSTTQGIISPYASFNLADDSLFLSQNGVYALELSEGTDSQRFAKERSLPINNLLKECNLDDLEKACATTYENKYYLAVKHYKQTADTFVDNSKVYYEKIEGIYKIAEKPDFDKGMDNYYEKEDWVYVADAHYTYKPKGAMADAPSYEWYPLTNIPVRCWFVINQDLYFGTDDGRVCRFTPNQYYDIKKQYFAYAQNSEANKYSQTTAKVIADVLDSPDDEDEYVDTFVLSQDTDIEDDDTIVFFSGMLSGIIYEEAVDLINQELYVRKKYGEDGKFTGNIQLKYTTDGEAIQFVTAQNLCAALQRKTAVKARRVLPTFDFGMPDYLKTLESFTIVMQGVKGGNLVLSIHTRNNESKKRVISAEMQGQESFNYLNGFSNWSYNVPFQNSFTQKVLIRNFNYCIFEFTNDAPVDCSVSSVSVIYKYNQASRGVQ